MCVCITKPKAVKNSKSVTKPIFFSSPTESIDYFLFIFDVSFLFFSFWSVLIEYGLMAFCLYIELTIHLKSTITYTSHANIVMLNKFSIWMKSSWFFVVVCSSNVQMTNFIYLFGRRRLAVFPSSWQISGVNFCCWTYSTWLCNFQTMTKKNQINHYSTTKIN